MKGIFLLFSFFEGRRQTPQLRQLLLEIFPFDYFDIFWGERLVRFHQESRRKLGCLDSRTDRGSTSSSSNGPLGFEDHRCRVGVWFRGKCGKGEGFSPRWKYYTQIKEWQANSRQGCYRHFSGCLVLGSCYVRSVDLNYLL